MARYALDKIFTSRDGKLEVDNREYGMAQEGLEEIGDAAPHLGGATHIFVKTVGGPSNKVLFSTRDGQHNIHAEEKEHGWAEYGLEHGSAYNPDRGEIGWWNVRVEGAESDVVGGIGLPYSWHVSTFVVFKWQEESQEPDEPEEDPGDSPDLPDPEERNLLATIYLYDDGTYELRNEK